MRPNAEAKNHREENFMFRKYALLFLLATFLVPAAPVAGMAEVAAGLKKVDAYTLTGSKNFLTDFPYLNADGTINVVVEIPTGTTEKWEVEKKDGSLRWEFKNGKPRIVDYLGYPGNYGMVPQTVLAKETGGDGDPLDVVLIGPALPRGSVVKAKVIGVFRMIDAKELDDKIIAVSAGTPFFELDSVSELNKKFNGITQIIETWFLNYKGPGVVESKGFGDKEEAITVLKAAAASFKKAK
jgi:inorganic pyrophosphatase